MLVEVVLQRPRRLLLRRDAGGSRGHHERDVRRPCCRQRRDPGALAQAPQPDRVGVHLRVALQCFHCGKCVLGEQVVGALELGIPLGALVVDQRGDAPAGEGLGLQQQRVPRVRASAMNEHQAGRRSACCGTCTVPDNVTTPLSKATSCAVTATSATAATPEPPTNSDKIATPATSTTLICPPCVRR